MTAETIYSEDSVDELVSVLRAAVPPRQPSGKDGVHHVANKEVALEDSLGDLAMAEKLGPNRVADEPVVLVAAKVSVPVIPYSGMVYSDISRSSTLAWAADCRTLNGEYSNKVAGALQSGSG